MPKTVHQVVSASQLKPGRLIVVGDVHGCIDELNQLLIKVSFKAEEDNLVFAGDLVNKGPASIEVGMGCYPLIEVGRGCYPLIEVGMARLLCMHAMLMS